MINIPIEPQITEYLHRKAARNKTPLSGTFELTPVCNMDCRMCYVRMSKNEQEAIRPLRTKEEWIHLAKEAKERGLLYLLLTGGEPFLRPDFRELLTELNHMGFIISINSNGTMIDEEIVEWLKDIAPTRINITLYGASDETYGRLCGNPKGYTQTVRAIRLLTEAGISVKLNCSVTPYNCDDLERIVAFAKEQGLVIQPTSYMFPPLRKNRDMVGRNDRFTPKEAAYYAAKIESLLNGTEYFLKHTENMDFTLPGDPGEDCMDIEGEGIRCRAGKCSFWVTWDGQFLPCGMMPLDVAVNVFESGFDAAWKTATEYAASIRLPGTCKNCVKKNTCKACAAMVYTESGDFTKVPEYRCQMTKEYPGACLRVAEEIRREGADTCRMDGENEK